MFCFNVKHYRCNRNTDATNKLGNITHYMAVGDKAICHKLKRKINNMKRKDTSLVKHKLLHFKYYRLKVDML